MQISIVISNWNGLELLKNNLQRVINASPGAEIIVVDDGSPDNSNDYLINNFPQIKLIKHPYNRGFAAGCNTGVSAASGEIVVLLNLDVVPESQYLKPLKQAFCDPQLFAVSFNEINNHQYSYSTGQFVNGFIVHESQVKDNKPHSSFWASGGSGAFRKKYWLKLCGFDEELLKPFYWEDIDLSYRAQKRGWSILWLPEAQVRHEHQSVIGRNFSKNYVNRIWERNQLLVNWKNLTDQKLLLEHLKGLLVRILKNPGYLRILFMAIPKLPLIFSRRRIERRESTISDRKILHL